MTALAMIEFGAASDVRNGFEQMFRAKTAQGIDVRFIDALNLSKRDLAFLRQKSLKQINFISHSLSFEPFSSTQIAHEKRYIGDARLDEAIAFTEWLAEISHAIKFNFYSCEVADKKLKKKDIELRDITQTATQGGRVRTLDLTDRPFMPTKIERLSRANAKISDTHTSSFELLIAAIACGKVKNINYKAYTPIECGGQVSLGDPENDSDLASPRASIRREEAHSYLQNLYTKQGVNAPCVQRADARNMQRLAFENIREKHSIAWDRRFFTIAQNGGPTANTSTLDSSSEKSTEKNPYQPRCNS